MDTTPDTRESLILRLPKHADVQAWQEFVSLYEPLIVRFARRRGLQESDAREIVQNVFLAVAHAVERWKPDAQRGPFRAWLFRIARNQLIHYVTKNRIRGSGDTQALQLLNAVPQPDSELDDVVRDYQREMFRLAASQIRATVQDSTWESFWRVAVNGESVSDVAKSLKLTEGTVYVAKSRVLAKLKAIIEGWEANDAI